MNRATRRYDRYQTRMIFGTKYIGSSAASILILILLTATGNADTIRFQKVIVERVLPEAKGGYGYKLQYYVPTPIETFWRFKTDFGNVRVVKGNELIGHRLVKTSVNRVITENRYASAPKLKFLWQTTVFPERYRLEFKLRNAAECRQDFHYGMIQLSPAGSFTKVTQIAYFKFKGASLWVRYPWSGGMKSTLTKVAKWEQKMAKRHLREYLVATNLN